MSSSELRYLITANELAEQTENVKQTDVANKLRVSKVSTYNAMERLRDKGFIEKNERKIVLTDRGKEVLNEYMTIIRFICRRICRCIAGRLKIRRMKMPVTRPVRFRTQPVTEWQIISSRVWRTHITHRLIKTRSK